LLKLGERIRSELAELDRLVECAQEGWRRAQRSGDDFYLDSVALSLHGFYAGLERLFELIATIVDGTMPRGANWSNVAKSWASLEPERIVLFGSRARGDADEHSDYDLVVIKRTDRPFLERLRDMVPYLVKLAHAMDILVYTPEEFDRMGETGLAWAIKREGVTLYERSPS